MSRSRAKGINIFAVILMLIILAVIAGGAFSLYRKIDGEIGSAGTNGGGNTETGTETVQTAPFTVYQGESDTPFEQSTSSGITIEETETFRVKHSGEDAEIKATITPLRLKNDYTFYCYNASGQAYAYSWNREILGSRSDEINICQYVSLKVDQEQNAVVLKGTTAQAIGGFAKVEYTSGSYRLPPVPSEDMFCLAITTGGRTMKLNCSLRSKATGLSLSQGQVYFGM